MKNVKKITKKLYQATGWKNRPFEKNTSRLHNFEFFRFDFFSTEGVENVNPTFQMPQKAREKQQQQHGKKKAQEKPRDKTHKKRT